MTHWPKPATCFSSSIDQLFLRCILHKLESGFSTISRNISLNPNSTARFSRAINSFFAIPCLRNSFCTTRRLQYPKFFHVYLLRNKRYIRHAQLSLPCQSLFHQLTRQGYDVWDLHIVLESLFLHFLMYQNTQLPIRQRSMQSLHLILF